MAKMTITALQNFVKGYVADQQASGVLSPTRTSFLKLVDKIGKIVTIDGQYNDKLPELDGEDLPLGKTIEEYFIDLTLPINYDETGKEALAPALPSVEEAAYSTTLGRKVIKTTVPYDNIERAALTAEDASNMAAKIMERLTNSRTIYTYGIKKQLLGNFTKKAVAAGLSKVQGIPTNTDTAEAFIKQVKSDVEDASFANEGHSLSKVLIGAAPSLTLFVKKGVMPTVEVDALAGAFNSEKLAIPANIKVVDDFGDADPNVYAILCDPRGVKLHRGYHAVRDQENADGDFINFYDHSEYTGFISKHTYIRVYKKA